MRAFQECLKIIFQETHSSQRVAAAAATSNSYLSLKDYNMQHKDKNRNEISIDDDVISLYDNEFIKLNKLKLRSY